MATDTKFDRKSVAAELAGVISHLESAMSNWENHQPDRSKGKGKGKLIDQLWDAKELINEVMMELDPEQDSTI